MRTLVDKENNLIAVCYEVSKNNSKGEQSSIFSKIKEHLTNFSLSNSKGNTLPSKKQCINIIDGWTSPDINKYILINKKNLGKKLGSYLNDKYVSNIEEMPNDEIDEFYQYYYFDTSKPSKPLVATQIVSYNPHQQFSTVLEYLIVDPNCVGQGIGTRISKSTIQNHEFIVNNKLSESTSWLIGNINISNRASIKMAKKCGYKLIDYKFLPPQQSNQFCSFGLNSKNPKLDINNTLAQNSVFFECLNN